MGCSHSKRRAESDKKKVSSIGKLLSLPRNTHELQRRTSKQPEQPNRKCKPFPIQINKEFTKSPFPYLKPDDKLYRSRIDKTYISSASDV